MVEEGGVREDEGCTVMSTETVEPAAVVVVVEEVGGTVLDEDPVRRSERTESVACDEP